MAVIGINYKEGNKNNLGYKSVSISFGRTINEKKIFDSGDFVKDWYDLNFFIINDMEEQPISHSSSVDHFIMDGAPFDSAYLHIVDGKGVLKYVDETDPGYLYTQQDVYEKGIEFFVKEGTQPTWEELKEMYGNKKVEA